MMKNKVQEVEDGSRFEYESIVLGARLSSSSGKPAILYGLIIFFLFGSVSYHWHFRMTLLNPLDDAQRFDLNHDSYINQLERKNAWRFPVSSSLLLCFVFDV